MLIKTIVLVTLLFTNSVFGALVCVNSENGNDSECIRGNCGSPCKTINKAADLALSGDVISVTDLNVATYQEYVQVNTKAVTFVAGDQGTNVVGGFNFTGDCSGNGGDSLISITKFNLFKDDSANPMISLRNAQFAVLELDINININQNTTSEVNLIDLTSSTKVNPKLGNLVVNFTSTLTPFPDGIVLFAASSASSISASEDFNITFNLDSNTPPSLSTNGYNFELTLKQSSQTVDLIPTELSFNNATAIGVATEGSWPTQSFNFVGVQKLDVTFQTVGDVLIQNCSNIGVLNGGSPKSFVVQNVNGLKATGLNNTNVVLQADYSVGEELVDVVFTNLYNSSVFVEELNGAPSPQTFVISVHNSSFLQPVGNAAIINPFGTAFINATKNYFGSANGPTSTCSTGGPTVSEGVYFNEWCLDESCTTFSTSPCGSNPLPNPGPQVPPTPVTPTPVTPTPVNPGPQIAPQPHPVTPPGITPGGIAGIVFGVLAVVILIGVAVWYFKFRNASYQPLS